MVSSDAIAALPIAMHCLPHGSNTLAKKNRELKIASIGFGAFNYLLLADHVEYAKYCPFGLKPTSKMHQLIFFAVISFTRL